eukprot:g77786.t1
MLLTPFSSFSPLDMPSAADWFALEDFYVPEDAQAIELDVMGVSMLREVTAQYSTRDGTAMAFRHYIPQQGSVTVTTDDAAAVKRLAIPMIDNPWRNAGESLVFSVLLQNVSGGLIGISEAKVPILDDEGPDNPTSVVYFDAANYSVLEEAGQVKLQVVREGRQGYGGTASVAYRTVDETAQQPQDFQQDYTITIPLLYCSMLHVGLQTGKGRVPRANIPNTSYATTLQSLYNHCGTTEGRVAWLDGLIHLTLAILYLCNHYTITVELLYSDYTICYTVLHDYKQAQGRVAWGDGQMGIQEVKQVRISVSHDQQVAEEAEDFFVLLEQPVNCSIELPDRVLVSLVDTDAGKVQFAFGQPNITLVLEAPLRGPVSVYYQTRDGSARTGEDYQYSAGVLSFQPGQTSAECEVSLIANADNNDLVSTWFEVLLLNPSAGAVPSTALRVDVLTAESSRFLFDPTSYLTKEGDEEIKVRLSRLGGLRFASSVRVRGEDDTAQATRDFAPVDTVVRFAPNVSFAVLAVRILADDRNERKERFFLQFSQSEHSELFSSKAMSYLSSYHSLRRRAILNRKRTRRGSGDRSRYCTRVRTNTGHTSA